VLSKYNGDPYEPIFQSSAKAGRPMPRSEFTTMLKARLLLAQRHLNIKINIAFYSAISWRKGGLSALAGGVAVNHLADHGDHQDIRSTREYTSQTLQERATHSHVIAARYDGLVRSTCTTGATEATASASAHAWRQATRSW
jgi:hypothetical protein